MPKERIWDTVGMYDLEVGWSTTHEYVQVGIVTHDGQPLVKMLGVPDRTPAPSPDETAATEDAAEFTSVWATVDRAGINRLIRMLRKARTEAYGKDE